MKITVQNPNTVSSTVTLTLNQREAELFTALIGASNSYSLAQTINAGFSAFNTKAKKTDSNETEQLFGPRLYRQLEKVVTEELFPSPVLKIVEFVYDKDVYGESPKWRTLHVTGENDTYIEGLDSGVFKRFLKSRIVGGRILELS
jgi:hypothetical protein